MRHLPPLTVGETCWRLPLCDATAVDVVDILLCGAASRAEPLRELIGRDTPFALWAICLAAHDGQEFRDPASLAEWLAPRLPKLLRTSDHAAETSRPPSADIEAMSQWAADAAVVAHLAQQLAWGDERVDEQPARLLAVVHGATDWLLLASEKSGGVSPKQLLPQWLIAALDAIARGEAAPSTPAGCVAQAVQIAAGQAPSLELPDGGEDEISTLRSAAATRWRAIVPEIESRLSRIAQVVARLDALENDFQSTLHTEKLASLKQLAYGASHEINNPLANIATRAQSLLHDEHEPDRRRKLAAINRQAFRATEMIADLMLFARPPRLEKESVEVGPLLDTLVEELQPLAEERDVKITAEADDPSLELTADRTQLLVALRALCMNSLEAIGAGGRIEIVASRGPSSEIQLTVIDDGPGIDDEARRHLFDPFYSGREAGRGLGFGLSKCWTIVTTHGGTVEAESPAGGGAKFVIRLPARAP
ncbi:MAG: HAMP domain-containing histidine kinase [Planctomycetes bacterium]|nr:HAMP domain-containing histidine kinase [Planctomycetota bacterium]